MGIYPPYTRYQARTDREIPLVVLHPIDMELYRHVPPRYQGVPVQEHKEHISRLNAAESLTL
jgi:hypothetical protein